ncbi:MAG: hypothetical protein JO323_23460 [Acidobacteriia bacterium]|nr:hypothetical protein [Terriglobia bacterium]
MSTAADEREAIQAIAKIIREQKELEWHQRANGASVETLQDSMVYAYDAIVRVVQSFMEHGQ